MTSPSRRLLRHVALLIFVNVLGVAQAEEPGNASSASTPTGAKPAAPTDVPSVVSQITAREISGHMRFLASDLFRGRDTTSLEIRLAAEYLATRLAAAGAEPAGGSGYFQPYPLEIVTPQREGTHFRVVVEENGGRRVVPCELGSDVSFFPRGLTPGEIEAPVVFAGYGRLDESSGVNDYKDLQVKNRLVLVFSGQPAGNGNANGGGGRGNRGGGMMANFTKRATAEKLGALGLLVVAPPTDEPRRGGAGVGLSGSLAGFGRPSMTLGAAPVSIPVFSVNDATRDLLFKTAGLTRDSAPATMNGVRVQFRFAATKEVKEDRNVVGLFPGSDPEKKKEVVIFSAHYDHVGVNDKGEIFNGSDDNASGTSALLEIAEAFGDGPRPARSVVFLWVSGEEKGLLGSQWFSDHVPLPEGYKIVADINLDMVSRNNGKSIGMTPSDKRAEYSTLVPTAREACAAEGLEPRFDADQFFERTDSANFARKGIPVIFFFSGIHDDYHKPTDDVDKADFEKAARVARAAYRLGWQTAQANDPPKLLKETSAAR